MVQSGSAHQYECIINQSDLQFNQAEAEVGLGLTLAPADYQVLLEELAQAEALKREQSTRIHHLEQALDQSLGYVEDLRAQLKDQDILENQLATTEEFSHVQQQAIARLKLQLAEQQQILDAQVLETQQRDQAIQELMATIETMTQAQQQELERLKSYLAQDQVEGKNHRHLLAQQIQELQTTLESRQQRISELESETLSARTLTASLREQLTTAQQQIKDLSIRLQHHQADWTQLAAQLAEAQSERIHSTHKPRASSSAEPGAALPLQPDLMHAHQRVEVLESQLAQHVKRHARWQHSHQQVEEERDRLQVRLTTLEQQSAEMQEQILHQAQQATEYETAVQYWKDRFTVNQRHMAHLRELLEHGLSLSSGTKEGNAAVTELLQTLLAAIELKDSTSPTLPMSRLAAPELPDFLVRRRSRAREQSNSVSISS
ncbi:MAG: hypothetical protein Kow00121_50140 [Elainellaceae cyanobacterium]